MSTEPQSIIHTVIRASSKLCRTPSSVKRRLRRSSKKKEEIPLYVDDLSVTTDTSSGTNTKLETAESSSSSFHSISEEGIIEGNYRKIDQNGLMEAIMGKEVEDRLCFVFFYIPDSYYSDNLHKQLKEISKEKPNRQFFCTNKNLCPFITSKMGISSRNPTVVAIKGGKVLNQISEFSSVDCSELKQWVDTIELLSSIGQ